MTLQPNRADLADYLEMIFGYVEQDDTCIALRGVGEKGGGHENFTDPQIVPAITGSFDVDRILGHVQRWSQHGHASFIVPAAIDASALDERHATEDKIRLLTTIVLDIDKGDTAERLAHAVKHLGQPSMLVHSGGTTETGAAKLHAYWRFTEASDQVVRIAAARKMLALKCGGDASFGRSTQVIRLPGSIYNKNGAQKMCRIVDKTNYEYDVSDILAAIEDMPLAPGVEIEQAKLAPLLSTTIYSTGQGLNFTGYKAARGDVDNKPDIKQSLITTISEGGDEDRSRWSEFNRVAGLHIHQVRTGHLTVDEARLHTHTWMMEKMSPPWPPVRFEAEWKGLLGHDIKIKGPMPTTALAPAILQPTTITMTPNGTGVFAEPPQLADWAVSGWTMGDKPKRNFLVQGLILAGKSHLLAAEGGAGKTFLLLDLALKMATHDPDSEQSWCGMALTPQAAGTVVMFTTEDDKDELHIRLSEIDRDDRRKEAGNRLVIIPTINIGGAFPLVERDRSTGTAMFSRAWKQWLEQLRATPDLKLVIIDTLNTTLHGEENNATVINEYVQAAAAIVCGELGAALIVTHHIRKPGEKVKIYSPEDMKNSIRGSTALIGAFRVALGIWHAPDYKERLEKMGYDARRGSLYNFAVVKANNPEMFFDVRTLLRQPSGLLLDITDSEKKMIAATSGQAEAWLLKAVAYAAEKGHPFTVKAAKKKPPNGRKHQLPALLQSLTESDMDDLCKRLIAEGRLRQCNPAGGSATYNYLDISDGPLAKGVGLDGGAYKRMEGADFTPPSWEHLFAYHPVEQRIVRRGEEASRTVGTPKAEAVPESVKGPGWNPNNDPNMRRA